MSENTTETTAPATETPAAPAKGKKVADRTVYATQAEAEAKKPAGESKVPLRLRPVTHGGKTRYTWATDSFSAVYAAALADGYKAGEPVDAAPPVKATPAAVGSAFSKLTPEEQAAFIAQYVPAPAAPPAEQPAAEQPAPEGEGKGKGRRGK
jgi:hypothetical protein